MDLTAWLALEPLGEFLARSVPFTIVAGVARYLLGTLIWVLPSL